MYVPMHDLVFVEVVQRQKAMVDHIESHILVYSLKGGQQVQGVLPRQVLSDYVVVFLVLEHLVHLDDIWVVLVYQESVPVILVCQTS